MKKRNMFNWCHPEIIAVAAPRGETNLAEREVFAQPPGPEFSRTDGWRKIGEIARVRQGWQTECCGQVFERQRDAACHVAWAADVGCVAAMTAEHQARSVGHV